jgi:putative heme-binding domain-containing protein
MLLRQLFLATLAIGICSYGQNAQTRGKQIFERSGCAQCHSVENKGGALGPDLGEAGIVLSPESLRLAINNPSAEIARGYETVVAVTAAGEKFEGIALNEDDISIQMRTVDGNLRSFIKNDLRGLQREGRSLMPSYTHRLSSAEIDSLVEYLETLKGTHPAPGTPVRLRRDTAGISENLEFLGVRNERKKNLRTICWMHCKFPRDRRWPTWERERDTLPGAWPSASVRRVK